MHDLIIRNGLLATSEGTVFESDLACDKGRITRIDRTISSNAKQEIDASGKLTMPGAIDAQVHFRDPGATHKEDLASGSRAAARGGVTSFLEMPNTKPPTIDQQALDRKLERAAACSSANYGFFIGATPENIDAVNHASPVCGIKIFMGSSTGSLLVHKDEDLERIFGNGSRLIAVHAEDENRLRERANQFSKSPSNASQPNLHSKIRDAECALLATKKAVELSHRFQRRLHVLHLTTAQEVHYLRANRTPEITVECTPNHLFLTEEDYDRLGTLVQMNPPIRSAEHQEELWKGLHDGTIDFIATDHAPHTLEEKAKPYPDSPSGMPGVETSLPLLITAWKSGKCSLAQVLKWMCWGPAKAYNMIGKGMLQEGYDADIAIVNDTDYFKVSNEKLLTKVGWSPFNGIPLTGWAEWTIVGGEVAYSAGKINDSVRGKPVLFSNDQTQ